MNILKIENTGGDEVTSQITSEQIDNAIKDLEKHKPTCHVCNGKLWGWIIIPHIPVCKNHKDGLSKEPKLPMFIRKKHWWSW